uniref:Carbonic anhydrase n=1 Tax=Anthurium amnicola TaxID=1678845 RepID=A0A1D1ZJB0_9ARAE
MATQALTYVVGIAFLLVVCVGAHPFVKFGYTGSIGPETWGSLSPDYSICSQGSRQSPINIVKNDAAANSSLKPLDRDYNPANATLLDNGFNVMLRYSDDVGTMVIDGKNYTLKQMHWHSPSEHTLDGVRYPVELHLLHASDDGNISVVAILYDYGRADPFHYQLKEKVDELSKEVCAGDEDAHVTVGLVETKALRRHTRKYFRYVGSFTTPPCTENVIWNILGKVREMSKDQAEALRSILGVEYRNNSRPVQPLNGRQVQMYHEEL